MVIWCLRLDFVCLIMSIRQLQAVTFERSPCHGPVPSCSSCRLAIFNSNIIFRFFWFLWTRNMSLNSLFMSLQEEVHSDRQLSRYYQRWFPKIKCILQGTQKAGSQAWRRGEHWGMREKSAGGKIDPPAESQGISDVCVCVCVCEEATALSRPAPSVLQDVLHQQDGGGWISYIRPTDLTLQRRRQWEICMKKRA